MKIRTPNVRQLSALILILLVSLLLTGCCRPAPDKLVQFSTIDALLSGLFDGKFSGTTLLENGDFGIGTFHRLEGEMVILDGKIYQVKADGKVYQPDNTITTPFASVCHFIADTVISLENVTSFDELKDGIAQLIDNPNTFYAVKITGTFDQMKTRSVPAQDKPYPTLAEVTKNQPVFEIGDCDGTIIGFYCPAFVKGVNVPGCHFHFLSNDFQKGGHILNFGIRNAVCEINVINDFELLLPSDDEAFKTTNLSIDRSQELKKVEQDK